LAELVALLATVSGRVQGVYFRAFVEDHAAELRLTGYVRNRPGNTVEVIAEGEKPRLEKLLVYLKIGPPAARVDDVKTRWVDYTGKFPDFMIRQ
jgi:acylphosphatase